MARSIEEIQADIARVKAEMALRDKYERGFNQPQTKVGWGSYIVNGDRGLLDAYQNRENQWKNMQEQQAYQSAERALQQKFQAKEAEYNRKLQEKIAGMNKEAADVDKKLADERSYNNARTRYDYALRALKSIPEENESEREIAERDLALAEHELNYYSKKLNINTTDSKPKLPQNTTEEPKPASREESKSVPVKLTDSKAIKRFTTRAARKAHADKLAAMDPKGQNPEIQEEIIRINELDTDEDKAERKNKWNEGMKLTGFDFRKWKDSKEGKKLIEEFGE